MKRAGILVSCLILVAGCAEQLDAGEASSTAAVVQADATADVQAAWRAVEVHADLQFSGGQGLLGFLAPRRMEATELHHFLDEGSSELFGEGLGSLLANSEVSAEGGAELVASFSGFGIAQGEIGLDSKQAFAAVKDALARVDVKHAWYLHGRSPASGSDYLVILDQSGMMFGFFVGIVG